MSLVPPKRLFHVPTTSTVMYVDVVDDVREKGYVAVSHVWGDQQKYSAGELGLKGGVDWEIPLSNPNKISRLVNAMKYYEKEYCWFDVLCMQQNRQDEINKEIPFMGDYYKGSDITFVLSDNMYNISEDYMRWHNIVSLARKENRQLTQEERIWGYERDEDIIDITKDKWFRRVWTLQECVLSSAIILVDPAKKLLDLTKLFLGIFLEKDICRRKEEGT